MVSNNTLQQLLSHTEVRRSLIILLPLIFLLCMLNEPFKMTVTPFLLAALTSYILMPIVRFINKIFRIPWLITIIIILLLLLVGFSFLITEIVRVANGEFGQLKDEVTRVSFFSNENISSLPEWSQGIANYFASSLRDLAQFKQSQVIPLIKNTAEGIVYFFAYFIATFYFLKDGDKISKKLGSFPVLHQANKTIQNYFRGLLILITIMTFFTYIFLRLIDIKFAFLISIFTGFAEVLPYVGPFIAGGLACTVAFLTGFNALGYSLPVTLLIIALGYFILRQLEDFFIIPVVIGKSIELHPLIILITTLLAGKLFGFLGLLFGVPFVGTYKVLVEYWWSEQDK
jgi:predicted PurR-regulated permease PerM